MMGWCPYDGEECHHDGYCNDCTHNKEKEGEKEMSHLHLICPHCLNDFYYNTITQSFEMKEGDE